MKNEKRKGNRGIGTKVLSLGLSAVMIISLAGCGQEEASVSSVITQENQESVLEEVLSGQVNASHSSETGKEETVYVLADAAGGVNEVIVSDWLKNADGDSVLTDFSELTGIENVKGYETFETDGDGNITWQAKGADIYYRGTTDKEVPVEVKVSYQLDGKDIAPEELAGKSGRVTIRLDYENKETRTVDIGGKKQEIKIPFAMISGMVLPQKTFSNIEVTNARLMSEGNNSVVVGVAFPGLKESINAEGLKKELSDKGKELEDLEIPDYIEVTADAKNFELGMTMTLAMSDVLSDIELTDSFDLSDINDSMDDLQAAANELKDGTVELQDGSGQLKEGTGELLAGTDELKDGASQLKDGTQELYEKSGLLNSGANQLDEGASALLNGTVALQNGVSQLKSGTGELQQGGQKLLNGTSSLVSGAKQLDEGADSLKNGVLAAGEGARQLQYSLSQMTNENGENVSILAGSKSLTDNAAILNTLVQAYFESADQAAGELAAAIEAQLAGARESRSQAQAGLEQAQAARDNAQNALLASCSVTSQSFEIVTGSDTQVVSQEVEVEIEVPVTEQRTISQASEGNGEGEEELESCEVEVVTGTETQSFSKTAELEVPSYSTENVEVEIVNSGDIQSALAAYQEAENQVADCQAAVAACDAQIGTLEAMALALSSVNSEQANEAKANIKLLAEGIAGGTGNLNQGLQQVSEGVNQLVGETPDKGLQALGTGAAQLKDGTASAVSGAQELNSGASELKQGIDTLNSGAGELADGAGSLKDGAASLKSGTGELKDGANQLVSGTEALNNGAGDLKQGIDTLKEGVLTLDEGMGTLDAGALALVDGMFRFDEEGISKLTELFGDDVQEVVDRLRAVADAGEEYNTFMGLPEGADGSVKFIIKTEAVK